MAMTLLRLNYFASNSYLSAEQHHQQLHVSSPILSFSKPQNQLKNNNHFVSWSLSRAQIFPIKPKRKGGHFIFHVSATTQNPITDDPSSTETANTEEDEEFCDDRLLAQNVPWNSTAEDIRALFEKYGTVLDVEVCFYAV